MAIGTKTTRVRIEQRVETADGQGGKLVSYALRAVVDAYERPLNGRETLLAAQVTAVLTSVWEVWFRSDISVKDRLVIGSRTVEIASHYDPDGRLRELYLLCSEVQNTAPATGQHEGWIDSQLSG